MWHAQETETFRCEFEHAVDGDFRSVENDGSAFLEFALARFVMLATRSVAFLKSVATAFAFFAAAFAAAFTWLTVGTVRLICLILMRTRLLGCR